MFMIDFKKKEQDQVQKYGTSKALILQELSVRTESPDIRYNMPRSTGITPRAYGRHPATQRQVKRRTGEAMSIRERMDKVITSLMQACPTIRGSAAHIPTGRRGQSRGPRLISTFITPIGVFRM
jgi:hypothetical protein